ncbi:unnamed protein product (plasmid) [Sinorhizobium meliloti Rm41]|nr:unnamed protein product [Sinorhizobium meliloti Rm41]
MSVSLVAEKAKIDPENFALANCIRALAIDAVEAAKSGHPGAPMGWPMPQRCCSGNI